MGSLSLTAVRNTHPRRRARGFTLLELLVVLVIAGIILGLVTVNAMPSERQKLQNEAQRIALLLQLARDEAIVRNRPITFEADNEHYRFLVREDREWKPITDDQLRERAFRQAPVQLAITPQLSDVPIPVRITFGREPVDRPFVLTLAAGQDSVAVRADGIGHFTVE